MIQISGWTLGLGAAFSLSMDPVVPAYIYAPSFLICIYFVELTGGIREAWEDFM
jgi:hypothetical protein